MLENLLERRQKMLKMHGLGFPLSDTVKALVTEYGVSRQAIYSDWKQRGKWIELILGLGESKSLFLEVYATHKEIYRLAASEYLKAEQDTARIGALRLLRDLNRDFEEMVVTRDLVQRVEALERGAKERKNW